MWCARRENVELSEYGTFVVGVCCCTAQVRSTSGEYGVDEDLK